MSAISKLNTPHGHEIAYHRLDGKTPGVVFFGGFKSDMTGTKATGLENHCKATGRSFVRFDYSGHGASSGRFEDGCISAWLDDCIAVIDALTTGPQILVGSSMGGWLALLTAIKRPDRTKALTLIAPAPDFTEALMWEDFSEDIRARIMETGRYEQPSEYSDEPYIITKKLIEDGRTHLLLNGPVPIDAPVRILHGQKDESVPWGLSIELADKLATKDVTTCFVKNGDHRLSSDADLTRLYRVVDSLC